jgi:hypothetical protein
MIVRNPIEQPVKTFYEAPRDLFTCNASVYLEPFKTKGVTLTLNQAAPVLRKNSQVEAYTASAQAANLTGQIS